MNDPIKYYFMDKMQISMFNFNKAKTKSILTDSVKIFNSHNQKKKKKNLIRLESSKNSIGKDLFDIRKATREKKFFFFNKIQKVNRIKGNNLESKIKEHREKSEKKTVLIKNQLNLQRKRFIDRIKERQGKSLNRIRNEDSFSNISKFSSFKSSNFFPEPTLNIDKKKKEKN